MKYSMNIQSLLLKYLFLLQGMLLIKNTKTVKLQNTALKVLQICPVLNGYVLVTTTDQPFEKLVHIDEYGKVLWERAYADSVDTFGLFNEREVITMNVSEGKIEVIDLLNHTFRSYTHQYAFDTTASMQIRVFSETKLFCIVQKGSNSDPRLFLTYYTFERNNIRQIQVFKSEHDQWNYQQSLTQVNNHSKIVWWKQKYEEIIDFYTYSIGEGYKSILDSVKVNITLGADYGIPNFTLSIDYLWETSPNIYMLVCTTNRDYKKEDSKTPNNNFILDVKKQIIRQTKFHFPDRWNAFLIDCFNLGEVSVFHTFASQQGQHIHSPVFYVHNEREEIISTEEWKATGQTNFYIPGFDSSSIVEAYHTNGDVESIDVTTKRLMTQKEMFLHFMLHINQDFDDDLLQDAIDLLTQL